MSITRIPNGGTVIVRTGVLQGVGPVGPQGARGLEGPVGPQGLPGPIGPAGFVNEAYSEALVVTPTVVPTNTVTDLTFLINIDEIDLFDNNTTFTPPSGTYFITAWVNFERPAGGADGYRAITLIERQGATSIQLHSTRLPCITTDSTIVELGTIFRAQEGRTYHIGVSHYDNETLEVTDGRIAISRIGAGQRGLIGPTGLAGPQGPQGIQGEQGPAGSASTGFTSFEDLRPA